MIACASLVIGMHLATYHFDRSKGYNDINPGVNVQCDNVVVGAYYNSEQRGSVYMGYKVEGVVGPVDLVVGIVGGYRRAPIVPLVIPSVKVDHWRLGIVPPVWGMGAIHISREF